ncbi:hypothetical protein [Salinirussus salinus]|uniref:hypothetical protein n=1 Tax=Salinirussus salinus TaxID=1198300 RepID=UPI00135B9EDD|nr:hypothetical protein [Salinirussus salinus]
MSSSTLSAARLVKLLGGVVALIFFPVTVPIATATNYRGIADRLASLPGIQRGGGMLAGVAVLVYLVAAGGLVGGTATLALGDESRSPALDINESKATTSTPTGTSAALQTTTPNTNPPTPDGSVSSTPISTEDDTDSRKSDRYERLLADVEETYPVLARDSYDPPYITFLGGSYDTERQTVTLNFSIDSLDLIERYEIAVARTAGLYVRSHFDPKTAYPETVTFNYFRKGELNATATIKPRWMNQYAFGNTSPDSYAPMSYPTYIRAVVGTLKVNGEKREFPHLLDRCENENPVNSGECKNSLRDRVPVRFYLPERTATGGQYTNVMGAAQPDKSFSSRHERLRFTTQKLEKNVTGTVSLEGYTAADETDVWKDVDMRIRDVYLDNETIVVEQFTRSEVGDDSLPLRQRDVIGAKYGRLAVNYGAEFMPANGVMIVQYTPDGEKYAKIHVPNSDAVGYINGETSLVGLGLDIEVIERYQDPGS